ncbi:MAG: multiprotein bridging factor aMBF1 [Pyrobaculum sp.]
MYCEICGRLIDGEPIPIEVDKAVLYACRNCAASYGKRVASTPQRTRPRPAPKPPRRELELVEDFHIAIKKARENLGLSRETLAAILGVKETVLKRIESGQLQPDLALARKMEKTLGVKLLVETSDYGEVKGGGGRGKELTLGEVAEVRDEGEE